MNSRATSPTRFSTRRLLAVACPTVLLIAALVLSGCDRPLVGPGCISGIRPTDGATGGNVDARMIAVMAYHFHVPKERITRDTTLLADLKAKKSDILGLYDDLQTEFGVSMPPRVIRRMATVGQFADSMAGLLQARQQAKSAGSQQSPLAVSRQRLVSRQ